MDDQDKLLTDNPQQQQGARQPSHGGERSGGGHRHGRRRSGGGQSHAASSGESRRHEGSVNASVNMAELRDLVELIATHGFTDFELEREGFRIRLRREQPGQPVTASTSASHIIPQVAPAPAAPAMSVAPATTAAPPTPIVSDSSASSGTSAIASDADLHTITSPIVGTFYRSPSPTAEPFVRVGSTVEADTVVCIVEAMKLMNEILAETTGTIEKIYVENAQPVEYGQPLFGVRK